MTQADWDQTIAALAVPQALAAHGPEREEWAFTRRAYADWLEEQGDVRRARFQRWLAGNGHCPQPQWGGRVHAWQPGEAIWDGFRRLSPRPHLAWDRLPLAVFKELPRSARPLSYHHTLHKGRYRSRKEAEEALLQALEATGAVFGAR